MKKAFLLHSMNDFNELKSLSKTVMRLYRRGYEVTTLNEFVSDEFNRMDFTTKTQDMIAKSDVVIATPQAYQERLAKYCIQHARTANVELVSVASAMSQRVTIYFNPRFIHFFKAIATERNYMGAR